MNEPYDLIQTVQLTEKASLLSEKLQSIDLRQHLRRRKTYPGMFPVLHLDHIYYDGQVEVVKLELPRTRASLGGKNPTRGI